MQALAIIVRVRVARSARRHRCIVRKGDFDPYEVAVLSEVWDKSTAWGKEWGMSHPLLKM